MTSLPGLSFDNAEQFHDYNLKLFHETLRVVARAVKNILISSPAKECKPIIVAKILHPSGIADSVVELDKQLPRSDKWTEQVLNKVGFEIIMDAARDLKPARVSALMVFFVAQATIVISENELDAQAIAKSGVPILDIPGNQEAIIIFGGTYYMEGNMALIPTTLDENGYLVPGEIVYHDYNPQNPSGVADQVKELQLGIVNAYLELGWHKVDETTTLEDRILSQSIVDKKAINRQMKSAGRLN